MSVLIRGIEMPTSCYACDFSYQATDSVGGVHTICSALQKVILPLLLDRQEDCPLVEVPPHGRLIDADALEKLFDDRMKNINDDLSIWEGSMVTSALSFAPTIIPAEDGT